MQIVTVPPKYQVVIPKAARASLRLRPGQQIQAVEYDARIKVIAERNIDALRGFFKGINTEFKREEEKSGSHRRFFRPAHHAGRLDGFFKYLFQAP